MIEKIEQLEINLDLNGKLYITEQEQKLDVKSELKQCKINLENTNKAFQELQAIHKIVVSILKEKEFTISNIFHSEWAKELQANLQNASKDIIDLFTKIDRKNHMERKNHGLVLSFGSLLDQSLKCLHKTILASVSQQHQQLRSMEEHVGSFLARKCDASNVLDSRIEKNKRLLLFWNRSHEGACSNITNDSFLRLEAVSHPAILEPEEVIHDIHRCLDEKKQQLTLSARQHEGLERRLVSAQVISRATIDFFDDLKQRTCKRIIILNENQTEKSHQLVAFGKTFQEESAKEEKLALEKIADIIGTLTSRKIVIVYVALKNFDEENIVVNKTLQKEMFKMQHVSEDAKNNWKEYSEPLGKNFTEDTFGVAESKATDSYDRTIRIFPYNGGHSREIYHTNRMQRVFCVKFTSDATYVVFESDDIICGYLKRKLQMNWEWLRSLPYDCLDSF